MLVVRSFLLFWFCPEKEAKICPDGFVISFPDLTARPRGRAGVTDLRRGATAAVPPAGGGPTSVGVGVAAGSREGASSAEQQLLQWKFHIACMA